MIRDMYLKLRDLLVQKDEKGLRTVFPIYATRRISTYHAFSTIHDHFEYKFVEQSLQSLLLRSLATKIKRYQFHISKMPTESDVH